MAGRLLLYPTLQRPVPVPDLSDPPNVAKFGQPLSLPPAFLAPRRLPISQQQALAYVRQLDSENVKIEWFRQLEEPPKPKVSIRLGAQQTFAYVHPFEVTVAPMRWWQPLNEPPKSKVSVSAAAQQHFAYQPLIPVPDPTDPGKWWGDLSVPGKYLARRRLETANQQYLAYFNVTPVFLPHTQIGWFRRLEEPPAWVKGRRRLDVPFHLHFSMTLNYPHLPTLFLEAYDLRSNDLLGQDARGVYLIGVKPDSDLDG